MLVAADLSGKLVVRLWPVGHDEETKRLDIPLKQLVAQSYTSPIDSQGNQVLVIRSPGDKLRVSFHRASLVFAPGETFSATLTPNQLGLPAGTGLRVKAQLTGPGGRSWSKEYETITPGSDEEPGAAIPLEIKLPDQEGVCDLTLTAINAGLRERLPWKRPVAERKVQLVVVGDKPQRAPTIDSQTLVRLIEVDPANPHSWERLSQLVSTARKENFGSGDASRWNHPRLGTLVQLGSGKDGPGWEAYPLPVSNPGQPHILEIEYPSDVPQTLGISLIEPNASGAVMPIGLDSGVYVSDEDADSEGQLLKHRIVFWPKTKLPLVLMTNRRPHSRAVYGKLRVLAVSPSRRRLVRADNSEVMLGRAFAKDPPAGGRLIAGYLERPLFTENFSAPESLDAFSRRSLDDWNTFYLGAIRLIEYLNYAGYNGLILTVLADGSSIYPSRQIEPTPRHDTGVFFANGQDPVRKDVLELLFRLFDREGLALIPAVQFSAPLAELEHWRHEGESTPVGLEWIGADGTSRAARTRFRQGLGPYYNPLNARVQQAMLGTVGELVDRYGAHPAFRGVGVQLSAESYAQLPGGDGSFDDDTIAAFERETKISVPGGSVSGGSVSGGSGADRFAARARFLTGPESRSWLAWRAENLAALYRRMGQAIVGARKDARLYLAGGTMFEGSAARRSLRPALPRRMRLDDVLLGLGLRPESFRDDPVIFLRPQNIEPMDTLAVHAVELELNLAPEVDRLFAGPQAASLFYHEPQRLRLASFDAKSPFGSENTYTWLVSQFAPSDLHNRERFIHSLATLDAQAMVDGGWLLPLGQEETIRELLSVYRELPAGEFEAVAGETQPVTIRSRVQNDATFVYLANDSPWHVTASLTVHMPAECRVERLGISPHAAPLERNGEMTRWKVTLRPYDLVGARFSSADVTLLEPQIEVPGRIDVALDRRIRDLSTGPPCWPIHRRCGCWKIRASSRRHRPTRRQARSRAGRLPRGPTGADRSTRSNAKRAPMP